MEPSHPGLFGVLGAAAGVADSAGGFQVGDGSARGQHAVRQVGEALPLPLAPAPQNLKFSPVRTCGQDGQRRRRRVMGAASPPLPTAKT